MSAPHPAAGPSGRRPAERPASGADRASGPDRAPGTDRASGNLGRARAATRLALWWERVWPRLLPPVLVVALFLVASWAGLWLRVPDWARLTLLALFALLLAASLLPFLWLRRPSRAEVDARVERGNALPHRPVTAQTDRQATGRGDPLADALWQAHQRRAAADLHGLHGDRARPRVARFDPFALRFVPVLLLFVAFGFAPLVGDRWELVAEAFRSDAARAVERARVDVWVTPPAYTQRPPVFLARSEQLAREDAPALREVEVPEGSVVSVRTVGLDQGRVGFDPGFGTQAVAPEEGGESARLVSYELELARSGTVELGAVVDGAERALALYRFTVTPDAPPAIRFSEDPSAAANGALQLEYAAQDDYGVRDVRATVASAVEAAPNARALFEPPVIDLPPPRRAAPGEESRGRANRDLTAHPLAGAPVRIVLEATDDRDQTGRSAPHEMVLPARPFADPLAKALVWERRRLALDANRQDDVAERLDIITGDWPEEFIPRLGAFTAMRVARSRLVNASSDDELRDVVDLLWEIAVGIEDGDLSDAQRRLRDAQERLSEALENGASDEEIERLMSELRDAMAEMMRELAQQQQSRPQEQQAMNPDTEVMTQRDLERMMDRIEDLARSGSRDAAQELLQELQRMMDNMQAMRPGEQQQGQQQQGQDQFSQQMNELGRLLQEQQELMDRTHELQRQQRRRQQEGGQQQDGQRQQGQQQQGQQQQGQRQQGEQQQGQQGGENGEQRPMTPEELAEALRQLQEQQGQLQQRLQDMQQALEGMGMEPSEGFGEAEQQMGEAEGRLGQGRPGGAVGNQGRAMEALRQGAQQMMQQLQQMARQQGQQGQQPGQGPNRGMGQRQDRDPLGRPTRSQGPQLSDDVEVPDEIDAQRAREILDAIRERLGDATRRRLELDYLDRLLPEGFGGGTR